MTSYYVACWNVFLLSVLSQWRCFQQAGYTAMAAYLSTIDWCNVYQRWVHRSTRADKEDEKRRAEQVKFAQGRGVVIAGYAQSLASVEVLVQPNNQAHIQPQLTFILSTDCQHGFMPCRSAVTNPLQCDTVSSLSIWTASGRVTSSRSILVLHLTKSLIPSCLQSY